MSPVIHIPHDDQAIGVTTDTQLRAVLDWVNLVRSTYRLGEPLEALPRGKVGTGYSCPIAKAVEAPYAYRGHVVVGGHRVEYPSVVREFVWAFDLGAYPELIDARAQLAGAG